MSSRDKMRTQLENIYYPIKNGTYSFARYLADIIDHRFTNSHPFLQGFIAQDIIGCNGNKQFLTINDFPAWLNTDIVISEQNRNLYEVILTGRPVRPYFDIEYDDDDQLDTTDIIDIIFEVIKECFSNLDVDIKEEDVSIFCASGECNEMPSGNKASYHFILGCDHVFRNTQEHKLFMNNILMPYINNLSDNKKAKLFWKDAKGITRCVVDNSPYKSNQSFRLPFQSKIDSNRCLKPVVKHITHYCIGLYENTQYLKYIELPHITLHPIIPISVTTLTLIPFNSPEFNLANALCALLTSNFLYEYNHALETIFCLTGIENSDRMRDLIHSTCSRASNYEWKWVNDTIRSFKYSGFNIQHLRRWAEECSNKDTVSPLYKQYTVSYCKELFSSQLTPPHCIQLNERFLSNSPHLDNPLNESIHTLIIKSLLGTGKTVFIKDNIIAKGNYSRILIISPRKSYTHSQKGTLTQFTSYLDTPFGDLAHIPFLIIQVESLHRIGLQFQKYDLVLLDEVESILNQLHSLKTNGGNLKTNHEALAMAVSTARHVIMADAFISDRTFNFSKELRLGDTTQYIENICNPYDRYATYIRPINTKCVANLTAFCERICDALRSNKKIVVVWTSKRKGDWFKEHFLDKWEEKWPNIIPPSWLFYNSDTSKEEQEGLKDVNEHWKNIQCLMMTTSITVGISYDPKVADAEFDEAFLYGASASAMPRDIAQALFRVRHLKANHLTYVIESRGAHPPGARGFSGIWTEVMFKENKLLREHPIVKWTTCPQWVRYNFVHCENEERCSRVEYKTILDEYLVRSGYELKEETHIPLNLIEYDYDKKLEKLVWDNIDDIDYEVFVDIQKRMKRGEATQDEILQYKKANFRTQFVVLAEEDDLEEWWNKFYPTESEGCFWNIVKEKRWTIDDMATAEAKNRYAIMSGDSVKKRETMEKFLKIVGMRHSQEEITISTDKLEEIGKELSKAEKEIRKGLGLRTSERKGVWKTKNTIDLITVVLESWGRSSVESIIKNKKINKKMVRHYSLEINRDNTIWKNIAGLNIDYEENYLKI